MALGKTTELKIQTPEGVEFSLPLAGPVTRCAAWAFDLAMVVVLFQIISTVLQVLAIISGDMAMALSIGLQFVVMIGYGIFFEWLWKGQTIGKRIMKLQVIDERGMTLKLNQIVLRNLFRVVDSLPVFYLVGGLSCLLSSRAQRLGDLAAGTLVVRRKEIAEPELDELLGDEVNSFREFPRLEAQLRQRVSAEEVRLAVDAVLRRNELESKSRLSVYKEIADFFRDKVEFPEEVTHGLSDEQYVRNVVATLFERKMKI
ncbi:MAG: RDD family protein [Verrucomicrobia bacterium]|nr:RDD family protein [Verrucomicrobiota bacterium]